MRQWLVAYRPARFDVVVVAVIGVGGQVDAWFPGLLVNHMVGPRALNAGSYALMCVALLGRRRAPLVVLVGVSLLTALLALLAGGSQALGGYLPLLIALYSVARYASRPVAALLGAAIGCMALVIHDLRDPAVSAAGEVVTYYLILLGTLPVGAAFRRSRVHATELERLAQAEALAGEQRALVATHDERTRIGRELHDVVAHNVSVVVVQTVAALDALDGGRTESVRARLESIEEASRQALAEMRRLVGASERADHDREPQPGLASVGTLAHRVRQAGLAVELEFEGDPRPLPAGVDLSAYRIIQEALTNALKHAGRASATVRVRYDHDELVLTIQDDGRGAAVARSNGGGRGLIGMRERAAVCGGTLQAGPQPDGGYMVQARLPVEGRRA